MFLNACSSIPVGPPGVRIPWSVREATQQPPDVMPREPRKWQRHVARTIGEFVELGRDWRCGAGGAVGSLAGEDSGAQPRVRRWGRLVAAGVICFAAFALGMPSG